MFDFIGVAIGILFAILIVSGIIFLIGYAFKNTGDKISFDISLNGYFYFVRLISGGVFCLAGISRILQGIFATVFGNSFSFQIESYSSNDSETMVQMFNGSVEASLFTGITTAIISGIIFLVHARLQSKNEFNVGSIEELYKFILFDSIKEVEDWRKGVPGEPLSIALSALIGWTITLRRLIRVISKSKKDS